MLIPCREPNSVRPKSFGEKWWPPPTTGKPMPGKPKFGGGPPLPSMDAIVEAAMDIETAADVVAAAVADKGGLDDGEREEGERSGEEEEG
jgi:hypothetical protein